MAIDIFNPQISVLSNDLSGKTFLIYGTNRTGKTKQATRFPKPFYWAFERGINGINGIPFQPIQKWADYVQLVKQITNPKNLDKAKEMYQTIIVDTVEIAGNLCREYICEQYEVDRIKDGNQGYGLWQEYADEFSKQLLLLTGVGFTVVFIAHEGERTFKDENGEEYSKIYPRGDKRVIDPICDLVDVIAYAAVNDADENGNAQKSSLYLTQTKKYHAGSRLDYLPECIPVFTAENLTEAVKIAVEKEAEATGGTVVSYEEQQETYKKETLSFDDIKKEIKEIAQKLFKDNRKDEYKAVVEEYLGIDKKVSDATERQIQALECILSDLKNL